MLPSLTSTSLPDDCIPVDVTSKPKFLLTGHPGTVAAPLLTPVPYTFDDYVAALPDWDRLLIQDLNFPDLDRLLDSLR